MTLILDLPKSIEDALKQEAARLGTTPENLALDDLQRLYCEPDEELPKTPAEIVAYWEKNGLIGRPYGDPALDAPEMARELRRRAETRDWT